MPADGVPLKPKEGQLTASELTRLARIFVGLGIRKIRITGGEPLVRSDIDRVLEQVGMVEGLREFALSTNGTILKQKIPGIYASGVRQLNISLDTLRPQRFEGITRRQQFPDVVDAILAAVQFRNGAGFHSVKINVVVMRGKNDDEILDFVRFGESLNLLAKECSDGVTLPSVEIRFIEFMPFQNNGWSVEECFTFEEMCKVIESEFHLEPLGNAIGVRGPAKSFQVIETGAKIGFITSMSEHFCSDCNRLRLTADGMLRTCLFGTDGVDLRTLARRGASENTIVDAIQNALGTKWEKHLPAPELIQIGDREMVMIGG
jgi:cyclic pyranopterin phosphate synthase